MNKVYIGLGSNLCEPLKQITDALQSLSQLDSIRDIHVSPLYASKPVGPQDQPDYVNAVALFHTQLTPIEVLDTLQSIEQQHNRVRDRHWGPRTLDLDVLLFNNEVIDHPRLTVPHPQMLLRGFVIKPLADITPTMRLPNGKTVTAHLTQLDTTDLVCL